MKRVILLPLIFCSSIALAQIQKPNEPTFESHIQPATTGSTTPQPITGFNIPSPPDPRPNAVPGNVKVSRIPDIPDPNMHIQKQSVNFAANITTRQQAMAENNDMVSPTLTAEFYKTLQELQSMLEGGKKTSVADAFFALENVYGDPYLDYDEYRSTIDKSVDFIKKWMAENELDATDNYMVHFAIQKFMSEDLVVHSSSSAGDNGLAVNSISHQPFYYDYDDYTGDDDYRNIFITKCLATGYGQCNSLPAIYLILAEELGVKAYLSFAPYHWLVKYPDNTGFLLNYEATSNWKISDAWYADNLFILPDAIRSGIYMDTLNSRAIVANCMFDLATEYMRSNGPDTNFILDCLAAGTPYFPHNNNLTSLFVYQSYLRTMLAGEMDKNNIKTAEEIAHVPSAKYYYDELLANVQHLRQLGYRDMPKGRYEALMKHHEFKGRVQDKLEIDTKEKRNLFSKTN